jgi:predicted O-methyltransferase YrrM
MQKIALRSLVCLTVVVPSLVAVYLGLELATAREALAAEEEITNGVRRMLKTSLASRNALTVDWDLPQVSLPSPDGPREPFGAKYDLSFDYVSVHAPIWRQALADFTGKPDLQYLEVGVFEGRSVAWMLENILTDPSSKVTAADIFPGDLEEHFLKNMEIAGARDRVTTIAGYSQETLRELPLDTYDIIYIDGSHAAPDVLEDAVLCWRLLKSGGVLIFDDYHWKDNPGDMIAPELSRPELAVNTFNKFYGNHFDVIHNGYQVIMRKY